MRGSRKIWLIGWKPKSTPPPATRSTSGFAGGTSLVRAPIEPVMSSELHQLADQDAGGAAELWIRIGDHLRGRQRAQEGVDSADVGLRIALAHEDADADLGDDAWLPCDGLAFLAQRPASGSDKIRTSTASPLRTRLAILPAGP